MELIKELESLLLNDSRKDRVIEYYRNNPTYLESLIRALKVIRKGAYNVIKTTRAGFTTNAIIAALLLNKSITLVEPTNKIATNTVMEAYNKYISITGDETKVVRNILSNNKGCSVVIERIKGNRDDNDGDEELGELNYVLGAACDKCEIDTYEKGLMLIPNSTHDCCAIKTMQLDTLKPDIVTVTYNKFMILYNELSDDYNLKNDKFRKLISGTDILLVDEMGTFIEKIFVPMTWSGEGKDLNTKDLSRDLHKIQKKFADAKEQRKIEPKKTKSLTSLLDDFLIPFVDGLSAEIKKQQSTWLDRPSVLANPLEDLNTIDKTTDEQIEEEEKLGSELGFNVGMRKVGKRYKVVVRTRLRDLDNKIRFSAIRHELENAIIEPAKYGLKRRDVKLLDVASDLIRTDRLVFAKITNDGSEEIIIAQHNQNTKIESLSDAMKRFRNKTILISDATLPPLSLSKMFDLDIEPRKFGDPLCTNDKTLIINYPLRYDFSTIKWSKESEYQLEAAAAIADLSKHIHNLRGYYPVVWCMSEDIAKQLEWRLNSIKCDAVILDDKNRYDDRILISYYKSIYSRGVANDRRVHIALGNAHKPKRSFAGLVLGAPNIWEGVFGDQYMHAIKLNAPRTLDPLYMVFEGAYEVFDKLNHAVQMEYTYADAWQAVSRAKDPAGKERSVIICMGWKKDEILELCQQGEGVNYDFTNGYRFFKDPEFILPRPHLSDDINDLEKWLKGEDIEIGSAYFELGIALGIYNMFTPKRRVLTHELVYIQFAKHYDLKGDHLRNGFFVGFVNLAMLQGTLIKTKVEYIDGRYAFHKDDAGAGHVEVGMKVATNQKLFDDFRTVMHAAYRIKENVIIVRNIHQSVRRKLIADRVKEILEYVHSNNLLKNSDWTIDKDDKNNFTITKNNATEKVLEIVKELAKSEKVIRSWKVQEHIRIKQSEIERIFVLLNRNFMLPSTTQFRRYYDRFENVITVT